MPSGLEYSGRRKLDLDPRSGEEVQALVAKLFASTPAQVTRPRGGEVAV